MYAYEEPVTCMLLENRKLPKHKVEIETPIPKAHAFLCFRQKKKMNIILQRNTRKKTRKINSE